MPRSTRLVQRLRQTVHVNFKKDYDRLVETLATARDRNTQKGKEKKTLAVLACVSGGSDSRALLDILNHARRFKPKFELHAVHFNHKLRGEEAEEDERFVANVVEQTDGLDSFIVRSWDNNDRRSQEAARQWRESELLQIVSETLGDRHVAIALGHHSDDSIETILMKILRGSSLISLQGISKVVVDSKSGLVKLRPLLGFAKSELMNYLTDLGLDWREDSSNVSCDYQRNRIRNRLVPLLEELAGSPKALSERFGELSLQSQLLQEWIENEITAGDGKEKHLLNQKCKEYQSSSSSLPSLACPSPNTFFLNLAEPVLVQRERLARFLSDEKGGDPVLARSVNQIMSKLGDSSSQGKVTSVDLGKGYRAFCEGNNAVTVIHEDEEMMSRND